MVDQQTETGARWYVIHTYSGYEDRVKKNLDQRVLTMDVKEKIFRVVVPTEDEIEIRDGQRRTVARKVFPGYILVEMVVDDESWYVVRNTPGVTGFVGSANRPIPLEDDEVRGILRQMEAEAPRVRVGYQVGQSVRVTDGPFSEFIGVVDELDEAKGKVKVLLSFFGRETPVELDFLQIEKL